MTYKLDGFKPRGTENFSVLVRATFAEMETIVYVCFGKGKSEIIGMPLKNGHITRQERKFAENYAMTGDTTYSSHKAGYVQIGGGSRALQRPAVQDEIRRIQLAKLFNEVLPLAVQEHIKLLEDPKTPAGAKVQAVKLAYDRTLGTQEGAESKAPHEMTADEIQRELMASKLRLAALERAKADQAKPVIEGSLDDIF